MNLVRILRRAKSLSLKRLLEGLKPREIDVLLYVSQEVHPHCPHRLNDDARIEHYTAANRSGIERVDRRLHRDRECYLLRAGDGIAHESWLMYDTFLPRRFGFDPHLPVIGDCVTYPAYRGKRVYPHVLTYVLDDLRKRGVVRHAYIIVDTENVASIRGIEKAGYKRLARLRGKRILGLIFRKSVLRSDES